ncbi:MAG: Na+/H+ antiporter subunit E [Rhodothermaceae bacterium]|nr:Na+/H+ antiporter subunit E [Rhodothermaceae bacterium]
MTLLLLNFILAIVWIFITGEFTLGNIVFGFFLGYLVLVVVSPAIDEGRYVRKFWKVLFLIVYFIKELFISSIRVAIDVMKPRFRMQSGVVAIPLDAQTDFEITLLANMISLTPGTLSLDVAPDGKTLYIHAMYIDNGDVDSVRHNIKEGMERHILDVTRDPGISKYRDEASL